MAENIVGKFWLLDEKNVTEKWKFVLGMTENIVETMQAFSGFPTILLLGFICSLIKIWELLVSGLNRVVFIPPQMKSVCLSVHHEILSGA